MEQQLSSMVLGRAGEAAAAAAPDAGTSSSTGTVSQQRGSQPSAAGGGASRGHIKRWQVESFAAVLRHLLDGGAGEHAAAATKSTSYGATAAAGGSQPLHVVDFGCGTGTLMLPLAVLFPHCHFTGVEMKPAAVALLQERARAAGLTNVSAVRGMIESFTEQPFDVALALHACGNATDAALLLAAARRAAYVVSPCCVGKLKFSLAGGSSFSAGAFAYTPRMPGDRPHSRAAAAAAATVATTTTSTAAAGKGAASNNAGPSFAAASERASSRPRPAEGSQTAAECMAMTSSAAQAGVRGASATTGATGPGAPADGSAQGAEPAAAAAVVLGELRHPRSMWLRAQLPEPEAHFRILAKVADQNHSGGGAGGGRGGGGGDAAAAPATPQAAAADGDTANEALCAGGGGAPLAARAAAACKAHVELDRNMAACEDGYCTGLFKVLHADAMAKGDLLVGVPAERARWAGLAELLDCKPREGAMAGAAGAAGAAAALVAA
ncbi:hypothetical protein HYH02_012637 [Chlamydomonas schloesseri]|uniref:Methyltransferase domain-containing protein n=1 Tax=Chlamydomonas schloesseri TaxID=2026947 RepID=A0A835T462_9CHLO|nr:hypothetical protein HYH02_012637 [Chlamydomonas schloesseri]|eukprot:KAG2433519.1 hypothetical protein HYH02_012637 [Chlamydomonas schloesseri]